MLTRILMTKRGIMVVMTRLDDWEDESTLLEQQIIDAYLIHEAESWGNSYIAVTKTALGFGRPEYVIWDAVQHYTEVVYRGEV